MVDVMPIRMTALRAEGWTHHLQGRKLEEHVAELVGLTRPKPR